MPAIGSDSGKEYLDHEILMQARFEEMKGEVLHLPGQPESVVVPVRNMNTPHFRVLSAEPLARRVGPNEDADPTHKKVINYLVKQLNLRTTLQVSTYVFEEKIRTEQIIFKATARPGAPDPQVAAYKWWAEARIQLDVSRYIQPDICGRSNSDFLPLKGEKAVIIEVIQSHYPDVETFRALTELSGKNFIVLFFFAAKDGWGSDFSRFNVDVPGLMGIRCAYWLNNGKFFANGECRERADQTDEEWYVHISTRYFDSAKKRKDENTAAKPTTPPVTER